MVGLPNFRSHSKSRPFLAKPLFDHSKSRLVWNSDPHCRFNSHSPTNFFQVKFHIILVFYYFYVLHFSTNLTYIWLSHINKPSINLYHQNQTFYLTHSDSESLFEHLFERLILILICWNIEVCVPKCHFPGTGFFPKNSGNFPVPTNWEHPSPWFRLSTGIRDKLLPGLFQVGKHSGIPQCFPNEN